jgi:4-amino-4-deoxy-L-arabinose transferase-like glycosyltransferase
VKYFLLGSFFILVLYSLVIHPFEVPDENAHYSSLTFLVNEGRMPKMTDDNNLSLEELETEKIFGIVEGQNKYSYHPEFRMDYVTGLVGKHEQEIKSFNTMDNRTTYSTFQAATYPPLYYWLTLPFYSLVSNTDILTRLFVSRFSSVIITIITVLVAYRIGSLIFKSRTYGLTVALMSLFFPMTTYVGAGVSSDNLHNLLFGIATLCALKLIKDGWSRSLSLTIGIVVGLDLITKPQAYILFPIFAVAVIIRWRWDEWREILGSIIYLVVPVVLIAGWQEIPKFVYGNSAVGVTSYTARVVEHGGMENFKIFITAYMRTHATEMIVWYWGVFKWFGIIMPKVWWWVANRLLGLAFLGLIVGFIQDWRLKQISWTTRVVVFAILANFLYIGALGWFDWQFYQEYGRSLGLQPRYYMPLLITQMSLFLIGLTNLGWNQSVKEWIRRGVVMFFLGLQLTSLYIQLKSYYDLAPLSTLIEQLSQYKPVYAKGQWWYLWFPLYFIGIITTTIIALRGNAKK